MSLEESKEENKKYLVEPWGGLVQVLMDDCPDFSVDDKELDPEIRRMFMYLHMLEERKTNGPRLLGVLRDPLLRLDERTRKRLNSPLYDHLSLYWSVESAEYRKKCRARGHKGDPLFLAVVEGHVDAFNWFFPLASQDDFLKKQALVGLTEVALKTKRYSDEIFGQLIQSKDVPGRYTADRSVIETKNVTTLRLWMQQRIPADNFAWALTLACQYEFEEGIKLLLPEVKDPGFHCTHIALRSNVPRDIVLEIARGSNPVSPFMGVYKVLMESIAKPSGPLILMGRFRDPLDQAVFYFIDDLMQRKDALELVIMCMGDSRAEVMGLLKLAMDRKVPDRCLPIAFDTSLDELPNRVDIIAITGAGRLSMALYDSLRVRYPDACFWMTCYPIDRAVMSVNIPGCIIHEL